MRVPGVPQIDLASPGPHPGSTWCTPCTQATGPYLIVHLPRFTSLIMPQRILYVQLEGVSTTELPGQCTRPAATKVALARGSHKAVPGTTAALSLLRGLLVQVPCWQRGCLDTCSDKADTGQAALERAELRRAGLRGTETPPLPGSGPMLLFLATHVCPQCTCYMYEDRIRRHCSHALPPAHVLPLPT